MRVEKFIEICKKHCFEQLTEEETVKTVIGGNIIYGSFTTDIFKSAPEEMMFGLYTDLDSLIADFSKTH